MKEEKYRVGTLHRTNEGYEVEVVEKLDNSWRVVEFKDEYGHRVTVHTTNIKRGSIKNPYHKSVCGVGYFGVGNFIGVDETGKSSTMYCSWRDMIFRCNIYSEKNINYVDITICDEWLNFQNYAKFYTDSKPYVDGIDFILDKDLMQLNVKNKVYSPETCVWLPKRINSFLTNLQPRHNTSGYTGVSENANKKGTYTAKINDFETGKYICIKSNCKTKEEASQLYQEYRAKNAEKVKAYLRSLNYLPEEIIQLIK